MQLVLSKVTTLTKTKKYVRGLILFAELQTHKTAHAVLAIRDTASINKLAYVLPLFEIQTASNLVQMGLVKTATPDIF
jgi:hypothetical protein